VRTTLEPTLWFVNNMLRNPIAPLPRALELAYLVRWLPSWKLRTSAFCSSSGASLLLVRALLLQQYVHTITHTGNSDPCAVAQGTEAKASKASKATVPPPALSKNSSLETVSEVDMQVHSSFIHSPPLCVYRLCSSIPSRSHTLLVTRAGGRCPAVCPTSSLQLFLIHRPALLLDDSFGSPVPRRNLRR
jgi:hypothetical protein